MTTNTWIVEYTDTFGGDPNYSWVERHKFTMPESASDLAVVKKAKKIIGLNGVTCNRVSYGDSIELRPYGMCTVLFINFYDQGGGNDNLDTSS